MFPNFVLHQRGNAAIWVDRRLGEPSFIARLADADGLFREPSCQIIKDETKITVGRLTLSIAGKRGHFYIKRYNAYSMRYQLVSHFVPSGAFRALQGAAILRAVAIPTAIPIAAVENRRRGAVSKSFFISQEIAEGKTADAYWREELKELKGRRGVTLRRRFLAELAALFDALHRQNIYHNDLKDANILVVGGENENPINLFVLDLEGVRGYWRLADARKLKNLVQIHRTLGRYLRPPEKLFFLKRYLGTAFTDPKLKRQWIVRILQESKRRDDSKTRYANVRGP